MHWIILFSLVFCFASSCEVESESSRKTLFKKVSSEHSNIHFENVLHEDEDFNIIEYLYFYNGGGVAIGDINNDGLPDIYFSSNQQSNKLYLNKGDLVFEDVTAQAGAGGKGNWKTGVTLADVNGDGFLDIFICGVGNYKQFDGENQLLINNGNLTFTDRTEEYGLSFQGFSTQASFFDYDNDGDLDMYLLNHSVHSSERYGPSAIRFQNHPLSGDKLYRNELIPTGRNHFSEVTSQAGIFSSQIGYGLGIGISDLNLDGYLDIYVSNDFRENDYLYINQKDGTFKQVLEDAMPHTSRFSMGNDIADINNDGWNDIVTVDMLPRKEGIIKTTAGEDPYDIFQFKIGFGYHPQLGRNALQLNGGLTVDGELFFSDIANFAGVEATDWSWAPLLADFDNDGYKDLFVANGICRRPNDLDYMNFILGDPGGAFADRQYTEEMPPGDVPNMIFRNQGDLTFKDLSKEWLGDESNLSNGAAYADLDLDGDLDIVTNNLNEKAFVYRNDLFPGSNFLNFKLHGSRANRFGIGAKISVHIGETKMYFEHIPTRGWQSSVDNLIHAGLGDKNMIDSVSVIWPRGNVQVLRSIKANQTLDLFEGKAEFPGEENHDKNLKWQLALRHDSLFMHRENSFISFNVEKLIPHMLTTQGPKISVADVNADNLDDFFIGGAAGHAGGIFLQTAAGTFVKSNQPALVSGMYREDTGSAFFDANGDGSTDLIVVGGGQQFREPDTRLSPSLYMNDGLGNLIKSRSGLPEIFVDASCVKPADIDGDGDLDLFIGGRVIAEQYGTSPESYILINNGKGIFSDQSHKWFTGASALGMVTDAVWVDLNNDKRPDLVVVGEWMSITIFIQTENGRFENKTHDYNLGDTNGWWNTIVASDMDNDGDVDLIAGNLGLNSRLRASVKEPVSIFIEDIDKNGTLDHLLAYFNEGKEYPFISRDQLVKQVPPLKRKFLRYESFRDVQVMDIFADECEKCLSKISVNFSSIYLENTGDGQFIVHQLPKEAQLFPIFSFEITDVNLDGHADILAVGNLHAAQPEIGRHDAGYGLLLLGDGRGKFEAIANRESGFFVQGEGRAIESLMSAKNSRIYLVGRNNDGLLLFE